MQKPREALPDERVAATADRPLADPWLRQVAAGAVAIALALGLLGAVWLLARPLALLFAGLVVGEALAPIVERLELWLPRVIAVVVVYLAVLALFTLFAWAVIPPLVAQALTLLNNAPELLESAAAWAIQRGPPWLADLTHEPIAGRLSQVVSTFLDRATSLVLSLPLALISSTLELVLIFGLSLYWILAAPAMRSFVLSLFPATQRAFIEATWQETALAMGGFVRAVAINATIVGLFTYVGLVIIGVDFPLVLALIAGLGEVLPLVGPWLAAVPAVAIALLDSPTQAIIVAAFYLALQQIEGYVLVPAIMRRTTSVPPLLSLVALVSGATLGGVLGAVIALPLAGALQVLTLRLVAPAVRRWTGAACRPERQPLQLPRGALADGSSLVVAALLAVGLAAAVLGERRAATTRPRHDRR